MVVFKYGNVLEAKEDIICHQVNCRGVMDGGLGLQIRNKYPEAFEQYKEYAKKNYFWAGWIR